MTTTTRTVSDALQTLHGVSQRISAAADLDALLPVVLSAVRELVPADSASLMLLDPSGEALVVRAATNKQVEGVRVTRGPSISWQAIDRREAIMLAGRAPVELGTEYTKDVPSSVCVPLIAGASVVGVLNANGYSGRLTESDVTVLQILGDQAAFAIERAELYANLQHFTGQLMSGEEEQRRRLARELHDGLAPILVSAYQNLQMHHASVPDGSRDDRLNRSLTLLKKSIQETRALIAGLRPATLDDLGLAAALVAEAREMGQEAGWQLSVDVDDPGQLSLEAEATLFRVLHEALQNVKSHAEANRVGFMLRAEGDDLVAVVEDDGKGFLATDLVETGARTGHFGLLGMRERLALLGGECRITSRPGSGTEVRIRVPLKKLR
jgi:signal transduction histidine kinase